MRGLVLTGAIVLLHLTGCSTPQPTGSRSVVATDERVVAINLLAMPVALNLNGIVGGDGFAVKVYAASREKPKAVPLTSGRLEILMFDGVLASGVDDSIKPRRTWTFSPTELAEHIVQSSIGVGYYFVIQWGDEFPTQNRISIQARFLPASGQSIVSAPSLITVVSR